CAGCFRTRELRLVWQAKCAQQVERGDQRERDPDREHDIVREDVPVPDQIRVGYELRHRGDLDEAHHDLDSIQPCAGAWQTVDPAWNGRENDEWKREYDRINQHSDDRPLPFAL